MKKNEQLTEKMQESQASQFIPWDREAEELKKDRSFSGSVQAIKTDDFYDCRITDAFVKDVKHGKCLFLNMELTDKKGRTINHTPFVGWSQTLNSKYTKLCRALWPNISDDFMVDRKAFIDRGVFKAMFLSIKNAGKISNPIGKIMLPNGDVAVIQDR